MRPSSCSPSALSTVKHVMIALTLGCAHRFMEPLEKLKLSIQCTSLCSAEVLVILQTRENWKEHLAYYKHRCHGLVLLWNFILLLSQTTSLTWSSFSSLQGLQSIMRPSSCSPSALSTVKHVMIALTLGCAHRFMEPLEKLKISMQCTSLYSAEVLVILQTRENWKCP